MKNGFSRRLFLQTSLMAAAGQAIVLSGCGSSRSSKNESGGKINISPIGLQLYSVPVLLKTDFRGTLKMIADLGYKEIEFAGPYDYSGAPPDKAAPGGYYGHTPAEVKQMMDEFGLSSPSAHIPRKDLEDNLKAVMDAAHTLGQKYLIIPFLNANERASLEVYKELADELNNLGNKLKPSGLQIAYHNHSFEFGEIDGQEPFNLLLENTDKDLVKFEMDLFWISISGKDPVDYFKKYPNRFPLVHCKNMATTQTLSDPLHTFDSKESTEAAFSNQSNLGNGIIDFKKILASGREYGVKHFIVERDRTSAVTTAEQEQEMIRDGYAYMKKL